VALLRKEICNLRPSVHLRRPVTYVHICIRCHKVQMCVLLLVFTYIHTHAHTHTYAQKCTLTPSHTHLFSYTRTPADQGRSRHCRHSLPPPFTRILSLVFCLTHTHTHTHTDLRTIPSFGTAHRAHCSTAPLPLPTHTHSLLLPISLSLSHTHTHTHKQTQICE